MLAVDEDYNSGMLRNFQCGVDDEVPLEPTMEATVGDTVLVKWMKNHNTNDKEIILRFGDFTDGSDPDTWEVLLEGPIYDDEEAEVDIPIVSATGVYSIQWYWEFNNNTFRSCGDVLVNVPEKGEEVEVERCPKSCSSQGVCVGSAEPGEFVCDCAGGWKGEDCSVEKKYGALIGALGVVAVAGAAFGYTKTQQSKVLASPSWDKSATSSSGKGGWSSNDYASQGTALSQATEGTRGAYNSRRSVGSKGSKASKTKSSNGGRSGRSTGSKGPRGRSNSKSSKGSKSSKRGRSASKLKSGARLGK